jgi:hypothetical protein
MSGDSTKNSGGLTLFRKQGVPGSTPKTAVALSGFLTRRPSGDVADPAAPLRPRSAWKPQLKRRLGMIIDGTYSRADGWKEKQRIHERMFQEGTEAGAIEVRTIYFHGKKPPQDFGKWSDNPSELTAFIQDVECMVGNTQIVESMEKVFNFGGEAPIAIVLIGDACEEYFDQIQAVGKRSKELNIRIFSFLEGDAEDATSAFKMLAELSDGAFAKFGDKLDLGSLLDVVTTYATGGATAVKLLGQEGGARGNAARFIGQQLKLT